ncbi:MAG: TIGR03986 family CRISPR-associated RAMP protein [Candidatus Adiutrix sp.]|nr:TIGR03986 family CRISPR-associated RAMP protein [Candidatus Adiutrix sp.]
MSGEKIKGTLDVKVEGKPPKRAFYAAYINAKGKPVTFRVVGGNQWFASEMAEKGAELEIVLGADPSRHQVTIVGKPVIEPARPKESKPVQNRRPASGQAPNRGGGGAGQSAPTAASLGIWATAPYNFIPYDRDRIVGGAAPKSPDQAWSGLIHCRLEAETPLLVAGPGEKSENGDRQAKERRFLEIEGRKVIPGSSLKGLLRSLIEALSFSRLAPINDRLLVYRDFRKERYISIMGIKQEDAQKGRELKKGRQRAGWLLRKGAEYSLAPVDYEMRPKGDCTREVCTGPVPKLKSPNRYYFALPKPGGESIAIDPALVRDFKEQLSKDQESLLNARVKGWDSISGKNPLPVFWVDDPERAAGELFFFGLPKCFRIPYKTNPAGLIADDRRPDFASTLFGTVAGGLAVKGRVAVGHMVLEKAVEAAPITATLGQPQPTCLPHYLVQDPEKVRVGKNNSREINPDSLTSYDDPEARLRGRKWYWHRDPEAKPPTGNANTDGRFFPVEAGAWGRFCLRADRLSLAEVGALLEALQPGGGGLHKLGLGKSLGLGSVRLSIEELDLAPERERYRSLSARFSGRAGADFDREAAHRAFKKFVLDELQKMGETGTDYEQLPAIKTLRAMMDYDGRPANAQTANMALHSRDGLSYKNKAVLRDALDIHPGPPPGR